MGRSVRCDLEEFPAMESRRRPAAALQGRDPPGGIRCEAVCRPNQMRRGPCRLSRVSNSGGPNGLTLAGVHSYLHLGLAGEFTATMSTDRAGPAGPVPEAARMRPDQAAGDPAAGASPGEHAGQGHRPAAHNGDVGGILRRSRSARRPPGTDLERLRCPGPHSAHGLLPASDIAQHAYLTSCSRLCPDPEHNSCSDLEQT
jgi:hypothetical protein